jgi:hypothetical protein
VEFKLLAWDRLISNRTFRESCHKGSFQAGRDAFVAATLDEKKRPGDPRKGVKSIDFSGKYSQATYDELEVDCLLKLPKLLPCVWTKDPADPNPPVFIAPSHEQALPDRPNPNVQVRRASASASASDCDSDSPATFSEVNYPANSAMYVMGEVYAPLGQLDSLKSTVQKLLQAERTLQFLAAKEGKPVSGCVLGVVFMGPHMDATIASQLFKSLHHYKDVLPCLWSLYGLQRLLSYHMRKPLSPAVQAVLSATAMEQLTREVQRLQQQLERKRCSVM